LISLIMANIVWPAEAGKVVKVVKVVKTQTY
jgi:hypothetical protein